MIHDRVQWGFTVQRALKLAQEWQTVSKLTRPKRRSAHHAPSCPFSKFVTTEASQGGVIALTATKFTRQHDFFCFPRGTAGCRQILWNDGPWTGREIEPAWDDYHESQGYKLTATCKECAINELCVLTSFTPTKTLLSSPSPPS